MKQITRGIFLFIFILLASVTAHAQIQVLHYQQHNVKPGETATSIAAQYNIPLREFLLLNDFPENVKLKAGSLVLIRGLNETETKAEEVKDKNVSGIKKTKPVTEITPQPSVASSTRVPSTKKLEYGPTGIVYHVSANKFHLVEKKQTCFRIALIYGLAMDELLKLNHLPNTNIQIGQRLRVKK